MKQELVWRVVRTVLHQGVCNVTQRTKMNAICVRMDSIKILFKASAKG